MGSEDVFDLVDDGSTISMAYDNLAKILGLEGQQ